MSALVLDIREARHRLQPGLSSRQVETIRATVVAAGGTVSLRVEKPGHQRCYLACSNATGFVVYLTATGGVFHVGAHDVTIGSFTSLQDALEEAVTLAREAAGQRRSGTGVSLTLGDGTPRHRAAIGLQDRL